MIKILKIAIAALILSACIPAAAWAQKTMSLRVMAMNTRMSGQLADYKAQPYVDYIKKYDPDVVMLQEIDRFAFRSGNKDFVTEVADALGMFPYFCQSIPYGGGGYGVALLCKYPFFKVGRAVSEPAGVREARACGWVYMQLPDGNTVRVGSVHLAVESEDARVKNIAAYNTELFKDKQTPTILAGDFNSVPTNSTIPYVLINWQNLGDISKPTIPASAPNQRFDYIFGYPKRWTCDNFTVDAQPTLSDHCFIIGDVTYTFE